MHKVISQVLARSLNKSKMAHIKKNMKKEPLLPSTIGRAKLMELIFKEPKTKIGGEKLIVASLPKENLHYNIGYTNDGICEFCLTFKDFEFRGKCKIMSPNGAIQILEEHLGKEYDRNILG